MGRFGGLSGLGTALGLVLPAFGATAVAATDDSNVAPCSKAMIGHGSADWRSESIVAGPVGVAKPPFGAASRTRNGQFLAKMPILVEGRAPQTVTVSVPEALRRRVFLYYGRIIGRNGEPTTSFAQARGYGETEFQPCPNKPRTIWPGGIRVRGRAPVHLLVQVDGEPATLRLPLGRPVVAGAGRGAR